MREMEDKRKRPRQDNDEDNEVQVPSKKNKTVSNMKKKRRKQIENSNAVHTDRQILVLTGKAKGTIVSCGIEPNYLILCFLYTVLCITCGNCYHLFPQVIQTYTKFGNFARLYFPSFTTFRKQILQF